MTMTKDIKRYASTPAAKAVGVLAGLGAVALGYYYWTSKQEPEPAPAAAPTEPGRVTPTTKTAQQLRDEAYLVEARKRVVEEAAKSAGQRAREKAAAQLEAQRLAAGASTTPLPTTRPTVTAPAGSGGSRRFQGLFGSLDEIGNW